MRSLEDPSSYEVEIPGGATKEDIDPDLTALIVLDDEGDIFGNSYDRYCHINNNNNNNNDDDDDNNTEVTTSCTPL